MRLTERMHFVPVLGSANIQNGETGDSINMKNYHHVVFILAFATGLTSDAVLTIKSGASHGAETSSETFSYRVSGADFGATDSDLLSAEATSDSLTLTEASYEDRVLVCELDADDITVDQPYLTLALDSSGTGGTATCVALLEPRYPGKVFATAVE